MVLDDFTAPSRWEVQACPDKAAPDAHTKIVVRLHDSYPLNTSTSYSGCYARYWTGGAPKMTIDQNRVQKFLTSLKDVLGVTIWQGPPAYVSQGSPLELSPCMYDESILQAALDSGKAEKRLLTVHDRFLEHKMEIVALKAHQSK